MAKVLGDKDVNAMRAEQVPGLLAKDLKNKEGKEMKGNRNQDIEASATGLRGIHNDDDNNNNNKDDKDHKSNDNNNNNNKQDTRQQGGKDVKSMEYHRQIFRSKMAEEQSRSYVSPSDNIMSPASAKISALRNKSALKAKPKSLFAQASAKKLNGDSPLGANPLGARPAQQ